MEDINYANLGQFILDRIERYGDSTALVDSVTERSYTFAQIKDLVHRLSAGLTDFGIQQGDVVCVLMHNNIDYPVIVLAVNYIGGVLQTLNPEYTDEGIERGFRICDTKFIITSSDLFERVRSVVMNMKLKSDLHDKLIIVGDSKHGTSYDSLLAVRPAQRIAPAVLDPRTTVALLLSSSGTTGPPKIAQMTHHNIAVNLPQMAEKYQHETGMTHVGFLLMYSHYGLVAQNYEGMYNGTKLVVMSRYDLHDWVRLIRKHKSQILLMRPSNVVQLVKDPNVHPEDLVSVVKAHTAAGPLTKEWTALFLEKFQVTIHAVYGLTETGLVTGNTKSAYKLGSSGQKASNTDIKIVDPDSRKPLEANQIGAIYVRGPQITIGYLGDTQLNNEFFDTDGYYQTGDVGYIDEDGYLFVHDRMKDLIKHKEKQIPPSELENLLMQHPDIADCAVIGITDVEFGEVPLAFVVRQPGSSVSENDIVDFIADQVPQCMELKGGIKFVPQIPRSPIGKILRRVLVDKEKQLRKT